MTRGAEYVVWKGIMGREHTIWVWKYERKTLLGKLWHITYDNIKMDI